MDLTAVFADRIDDQCLLQRLLPKLNGILFFNCDLVNAIEYNCNAIVIFHRVSTQCRRPILPSRYNTSRLVVLSDCSQEKTIVDTLNAGAHRYVSLHEPEKILQARINAALRCHLQRECQTLDVEPYIFNQDKRTAYYGNRLLDLSPREFELAYYLFSNRDRVVTDSELMTSVWTLPPSLDTRRIDTSICRIKKKMNLNSVYSKWNILRLHRKGYQVTG